MASIWEFTYYGAGRRSHLGTWANRPTVPDLLSASHNGLVKIGAEFLVNPAHDSPRGESGWGHYYLNEVELVPGSDHNQVKWDEFKGYVSAVAYKPGWYIRTGIEAGGPSDSRMWLQIGVTEEAEISFDPIAGKKVPWRGGKHYLYPHMCRQEIIGTIHHAFVRAEMHEVNEWFRYRGRSIYNPHLDPDSLVEVATYAKNFNTRENAMTMEEPT